MECVRRLQAWWKLIPVPQPNHSGVERGSVNGNSSRVGFTFPVPARWRVASRLAASAPQEGRIHLAHRRGGKRLVAPRGDPTPSPRRRADR